MGVKWGDDTGAFVKVVGLLGQGENRSQPYDRVVWVREGSLHVLLDSGFAGTGQIDCGAAGHRALPAAAERMAWTRPNVDPTRPPPCLITGRRRVHRGHNLARQIAAATDSRHDEPWLRSREAARVRRLHGL